MREIAGDCAATVARAARTGAGRAAAREAVGSALAPTLLELRHSAFALLDRMLPTEALDGYAGATAPELRDLSEVPV